MNQTYKITIITFHWISQRYLNLYQPIVKQLILLNQENGILYIDGSHDYSIVKKDISNSIQNLSKDGIIVLDDSSLFQNFNIDEFTFPVFKGHEGPSTVNEEILKENKLNFLFGVGHNNIFINT